MTTRCFCLSRTLFRVAMALAISGVPVTMAGGCSGGAQRHASVAHGDLYKSGNANYDEFFEDLYELQQKVKGAGDEDKNARKQLGEFLGSSPGSVEELLRKARVRVEQLAQNKAKVHFEIDGIDEQGRPLPGKPVTVRPVPYKGKSVPKEAVDFGQAFDATAKSEAQLWEKYGPLSEKARRMEDKADALAGHVDAEFESEPRRKEVRGEFKAAKSVLSEISEQTDKVFDASTDFLQGSIEVLAAGWQPQPGKEKVRDERPKDRDRRARGPRTVRAAEPSSDRGRSAPAMKVRTAPDTESASPSAAAPAAQTPPPPDFNP